MELTKRKIGDKEVFPFTIPSGIITTDTSSLENIANEVLEIGVLTTKSIGLRPRLMPTEDLLEKKKAGLLEDVDLLAYREPILAQFAPYHFVNAVGLANPGAEEFSRRLGQIQIPEDKFLLVSIFGKDEGEFVDVANILKEHADGFELNLSCPHAKGVGMQLGQNPELVRKIVAAVKTVTGKPIFAKLTPNVSNIAEIARAAIEAGAYGITAINTVGPIEYKFNSHCVLTNKKGGESGRGITATGIKCVKDITDSLGNIPLIGCGGIYTATDVIAYANAGASFFGVGTALAGMSEQEIKSYFKTLVKDLKNGTNNAGDLIKKVNMEYQKFLVARKISPAKDFHILQMEGYFKSKPGQFVFAWLPEKGEKPFSVMDDDPLTIGFSERGCFTRELARLKEGDQIYFRGPYGNTDLAELVEGNTNYFSGTGGGLTPINNSPKVVLVGGGCGIAGIYMFAKASHGNHPHIFLGAKDKDHIPLLDELKRYGIVYIATEDGSLGSKGLVSELLQKGLNELREGMLFINCGPRAMIDAVVDIERRYTVPEMIYSSIDYMTKCGVGVCGSCADKKGLRTCVEGPFMDNS